MSGENTAGQFHFAPLTLRPDGTPRWRITVSAPSIGQQVARLLDGVTTTSGLGLDIVTDRTTVTVVVDSVTEREIRFRLAEAARLGPFLLSFASWPVRDVMGPLPPCAGRLALLDLRALDFTTRLGALVRYGQPILSVRHDWSVVR
jgi:hypothetical protein